MDAETTGLVDLAQIAEDLGAPKEATPKKAEKPAEAQTETEPEVTEEPEEVAETEPEEEVEEEEPEEEEAGPEATPEELLASIEKQKKRIGQLTARTKTAEEKLKALEPENENLKRQLEDKPPVVVEGRNGPLDAITSLEELETKVEQAKKVRAWARANIDGGTIKSANGERELDADEVRQHLDSADAILESAGDRKAFLQQREALKEAAKVPYPFLFDKNAPAYKRMAKELEMFPVLTRLPDYELRMGDQMLGELVRSGQYELVEKKKPVVAAVEKKKTPIAPPNPKASASPKSSAKSSKPEGELKSFLAEAFGAPA